MRRKAVWAVGLVLCVLGLVLLWVTSGMAQEANTTPTTEGSAAEATTEPVSPITITALITTTAEVTPTEEVTMSKRPVIAPAEPISTAITAKECKALELTVYNQNVGLVKEVRTVELTKGENLVRYVGVPSKIDPTSVHFVSLTDPEGTAVLEQNYEYDLVDSSKLLQKYIDRQITVVTKGGTYTGTLLSGVDDIILDTQEGVKVLKLNQVLEFAFPELPEGLITQPSLVWLLKAARAGNQDVQVAYLTDGINWRADYIVLLAPDDENLSLTGWVTLDNQSGATYKDAKLKLVAGDIHRVSRARPEAALKELGTRAAAAPQVEERAFFEYHIYEVTRPVTVRDRQTKQIEFISAPEVKVDKVYLYEASPVFIWRRSPIRERDYGILKGTKVKVRLEFKNSEASGLGLPLPEGIVRVYKEDVDGSAQFVGEDFIQHTPKDEELSLYLGDAFDVVGERVQKDFTQLSKRSIEETYEITIRNHKEEDIVVRVLEHLFRAQDARIVKSSEDYTMPDAHTLRYDLKVPADGQSVVTYTVRYRW